MSRTPPSDWRVWQIADSAFPTGGFAHSWGLESAWQHGEIPDGSALREFLRASVWQAGRGVLPLTGAACDRPERLGELDALADAFLIGTVANRASRVQGRTFFSTCLRVWDSPALQRLDAPVRAGCGHLAPIMGAALGALGLSRTRAQQIALYTSARGVLSAAVRLGIVGAYEAQQIQHDCAADLDAVLERCCGLTDVEVCQTAPILDLLQSGHDRLYSRLFQS